MYPIEDLAGAVAAEPRELAPGIVVVAFIDRVARRARVEEVHREHVMVNILAVPYLERHGVAERRPWQPQDPAQAIALAAVVNTGERLAADGLLPPAVLEMAKEHHVNLKR